jgi:hypothetical protein
MSVIRWSWRVVALTLMAVFVLASCASPPAGSAGSSESVAAADVGRAFGRVLLVEYGRDVRFNLLSSLALFVRSVRTGEIQRIEITNTDGRFSWALPPGEYVIVAYLRLNRTGRIWTTFTVPEPKDAAYIGDLRIEIARTGYRFSIRDVYADALMDVETTLEKEGRKPVPSLMRLEVLPGSYRRVTSVCAAEWGLECDRANSGVRPVSPLHGVLSHPVTDSLTPKLAWSPVNREGVTYDVAIYESLFAPGLARARGALVAYAERLNEPSFTPGSPLAAGKRYEWSVRLRQGDAVSTWSTTGYFVFFVVGWVAGSGNWFGFATPDGK